MDKLIHEIIRSGYLLCISVQFNPYSAKHDCYGFGGVYSTACYTYYTLDAPIQSKFSHTSQNLLSYKHGTLH